MTCKKWERLTNEDQLSCGDEYFIAMASDPHVYIMDYDGNELSCEAMLIPMDVLDQDEYYFIPLLWPDHPGKVKL